MADPLVVTQLRDFKAQLLAREAGQMVEMTRRWLEVEHALDARITELAQEIADAGGYVSRGKWRQMERYRALLAQARVEVGKYVNGYVDHDGRQQIGMVELITRQQGEYAALGLRHANEAIQASFWQAGEIGPAWNRLPVTAVENMIGFAGDGAPLHSLLVETFPEAWQGLEQALIKATALGLNPRDTAVKMRDGFGLGLNKAMTIARTEQLRAYRMATTEQYRASGVVRGFRRLAAHDMRTCLACLAAEGETFSVESELDDHPNGRCTAVPILDGVPEVPFTRGEEWFRTLDPTAQKEMMGPGRFAAWQRGEFQFSDLVTTKHSDVWGDSPSLTPLAELGVTG